MIIRLNNSGKSLYEEKFTYDREVEKGRYRNWSVGDCLCDAIKSFEHSWELGELFEVNIEFEEGEEE